METMNAEHFVRRVKREMKEQDARFVFFLGAGCSISSGIPGAGRLVQGWLPKLHNEETGGDPPFDTWLEENFPEHDSENSAASYAKTFKRLCRTPLLRQREIERIVTRKDPAFGYAVLAQLIADPEFGPKCNRILTTNFDDLVADALYLYTRNKPLVIIHESLIGFVEIGRNRPLVIKLHGDAMLDPKNIEDETIELNSEVLDVLAKLLDESGLIFLGYGGNDESIYNCLSSLPTNSLPVGVYWVSEHMPETPFGTWLNEKDGAFWVRHKDFDKLMVLIRREFDLSHPDEKRFEALMETYKDTFTNLSRDVAEMPESAADKDALESAVAEATKDFENWFSVEIEAARYIENDSDRADGIYREGIEKFPENASLLGNYAIFLMNKRGDIDGAETSYKRALEADPDHPLNLCNYAIFLLVVRRDIDGAETYFRRALKVDPDHTTTLSNYGRFLSEERRDMDAAESCFQRALKAGPDDASVLGNYAVFLYRLGADMDGAESYFQSALKAEPNKVAVLGNYATFLAKVRRDMDGAERFYKRVLKADPNGAIFLGNYGGFLLSLGRSSEGFEYLERALSQATYQKNLILECEYYRFAHASDSESKQLALREIKRLVKEGTRSSGWDFSNNVERARKDGHGEIRLVEQLAKVIADYADAKTLNRLSAWKRA